MTINDMTSRLITYTIAALALATITTSCSKADGPNQPSTNGQIKAKAQIASTTPGQATKATFNPNDALEGVVFYKVDGSDGGFHLGESTLGTIIAYQNDVVFNSPLMYDITNTKHSYIWATYPKGYSLSGDIKLSWPIDGKTDIMHLAQPWDAGIYTAPNTQAMVLEHQLSRIEVVCYADPESDRTLLDKIWGKITSIEVMDTPLQYIKYLDDLRDGTDTRNNLKMLKNDYTTAFEKVPVPASDNTIVTAAAMVHPATSTTGLSFKLMVITTKVGPMVVNVNIGGSNSPLAPSRIYTVRLEFTADMAANVNVMKIADWTQPTLTQDK